MKFAFSTPIPAQAQLEILAARARELCYDGLELALIPDDIDASRAVLASSGVAAACLNWAGSMPRKQNKRARAAAELPRWIDAAQKLDCNRVKISGYQAARGQTGQTAAAEFSEWILPLADYAGQRGVILVIENGLSFSRAKELWMLLESINHPSVAACWDLYNATQAGESPYVSAPCLNSRIQYARVKDLDPAGQYLKMGEGSALVESFLTRLRGIGYGGYVTVETADGLLGDAIEKLRAWTKPAVIGHGKKPAEIRRGV